MLVFGAAAHALTGWQAGIGSPRTSAAAPRPNHSTWRPAEVGGSPAVVRDRGRALLSISPGNLDPTLNVHGTVITDLGHNDEGFAVAYDSHTGDTIVAGQSNNSFALAAYRSDGSLDTSFGTGGTLTLSLGIGQLMARAIAIDSSGNIVVAGEAEGSVTTGDDFAVARFLPSGTLDTSFRAAHTGYVLTDIAGAYQPDQANAITIHGSGNIVVAGQTDGTDTAVVRYTSAARLILRLTPAEQRRENTSCRCRRPPCHRRTREPRTKPMAWRLTRQAMWSLSAKHSRRTLASCWY